MTKASDKLAEHNIINHSASNYDTLIDVAIDCGYIEAEQKDALLAFRNNPDDESWINK